MDKLASLRRRLPMPVVATPPTDARRMIEEIAEAAATLTAPICENCRA